MTDEEDETLRWVSDLEHEVLPEKRFEIMASILLRGWHTWDARSRYLSRKNEAPFRQGLAELLRGKAPLSRDIRDALADLIAADDEFPNERKIEFAFRRKGSRSKIAFKSEVSLFVEDHVLLRGGLVEDGVQAAAARYGLDERTVEKYWSRHAKVWGIKIPPGRRPKKKRA